MALSMTLMLAHCATANLTFSAPIFDPSKTCIPGGPCPTGAFGVKSPLAARGAAAAPSLPFPEKYGPLVVAIEVARGSWGGNISLILGDVDNPSLFEYTTDNMTADVRRVLGSGSKWIASTALLAMIDAANASVDDPMSKFLPYWKDDGRKLKHFLQMTSGMVSDGTDQRVNGAPDNDDRKKLGTRQELLFANCSYGPRKATSHADCMQAVYEKGPDPIYEPGQYFMYGTLTFNFVAAAMEAAHNKPIDQLLQEYLLGPLDFKGPWGDGAATTGPTPMIPMLGAGLVASNRELARFLQRMLQKSFLKPETHDRQEKIEMTFEQYSTQNQGFGPYGFGIWGECINGCFLSGWPESCQNNQRITHPGCFGYWDFISRRDGYFFSMMPSYTCDERNGWCGTGHKPEGGESCPELSFSGAFRQNVIGQLDDLFVKL